MKHMGILYNTKRHFAHKDEVPRPDWDKEFESMEYHLICFGELRSPYLGNGPEHNIEARWIFRGNPYRLFSVTQMGRVPQELCLMFDCYREEKKHDFGSIFFHPIEETAREFSALLSLITRRRVSLLSLRRSEGHPVDEAPYAFSGHYRESDLPLNRKTVYGFSREGGPTVTPLKHYNPLKEITESEFQGLLQNLLHLDSPVANAFVLSLRLYHAALEMMYQSTDAAYLLLVSAIEAAASIEFKTEKKRSRFVRFISKYLAASFWQEKDDFFVLSNEWSKYTPGDLEDRLKHIYDKRSGMLHDGVAFPPNIELGPRSWVRPEATLELFDAKTHSFRVPCIPWFERVVNSCLLEFLSRKEEKGK